FEPQPGAARDQLLATPLGEYEASWATILAPKASHFGFDVVVANFTRMIASLFEAIVPTPPRPAFGVSGVGGVGGGPGRRAGRSVGAATPSFFSGGVRNTIMNAGRTLTMVELMYDGYRRLVEPYKL